jgi:hypothetical protein
MARRDGSDKREALARRRTIGRLRLAAVGFVLGCILGASLAGIIAMQSHPEAGPWDRVSPHLVAVEPEEGAPIAAGNATFRITFSEILAEPPIVSLEGAASILLEDETFDGTDWQGASAIPPGLGGAYNLTIASVRDRSGNAMPLRTINYLVDTDPPRTRTYAPGRSSAPFEISWDASDGDGSGVARVELRYREGSGPWLLLASSLEASAAYAFDPGDRESNLTFCAQAVDRAGNREGACTEGTIVDYDATPPGASLLPQPYWALGPVDLSGIAANNASDAELRFHFASDNATWQGPFSGGNATNPFRWTFAFPLGAGHYRLSARGRDARGSVEPEQGPTSCEVAIGLDTAAPASRIDPLSSYWRAEPVAVFANASDERSGVVSLDLYYAYRPNGTAAWSPWTRAATRVQSPWTFTFDFPRGDGRYELSTRARDGAGREESLPPIGQGDVTLSYNAQPPESAALLLPVFIDSGVKRTNVTWNASPAPDVVHFEVHRGTTSAFSPDGMACENSETCVLSLSREDRTAWIPLPQENVTYFLRVRTIDDGGRSADGNAYGAVFHGLGFDTPNGYPGAVPLPLGIAWSERLNYNGICLDCVDAFKVTLARGDVLSLSLAVPSTGDFRLLVANSAGTTVAESRRTGFGVWESLQYEATAAGTFYVLIDWSNVIGPGNRNEGWYTLAATVD